MANMDAVDPPGWENREGGDSGGDGGCGCLILLAAGLPEFFGSNGLQNISFSQIFRKTLNSLRSNESVLQSLILEYQRDLRESLRERFPNAKCLFEPTCSEYGLEAIRKYGDLRGGFITAGRIIRCNSLSVGGYDPIR